MSFKSSRSFCGGFLFIPTLGGSVIVKPDRKSGEQPLFVSQMLLTHLVCAGPVVEGRWVRHSLPLRSWPYCPHGLFIIHVTYFGTLLPNCFFHSLTLGIQIASFIASTRKLLINRLRIRCDPSFPFMEEHLQPAAIPKALEWPCPAEPSVTMATFVRSQAHCPT